MMADKLEGFFAEHRARYISPDVRGRYCVGSKNLCSHFVDDGATRIEWGEEPAEEHLSSIRTLHFIPTKSQIKKPVLPSYVSRLKNLEYLSIPFPFLLNLDQSSLPVNLKSLAIENSFEYEDALKGKEICWPDIVLPKLKALIFLGDYEPSTMWVGLRMEKKNVPSLEYLKTNIDKAGAVLDSIKNLEISGTLEIAKVNSHNIFDYVDHRLLALEISDSSAGFDISHIARLKNIEMISLNSLKSEIDCEIFLGLPALKEIEIISSKKIKNIDALIERKNLKSLLLLDCGNPLKKEGKQKFKAAGFERLDVDYS
jgi:hypothetical protein